MVGFNKRRVEYDDHTKKMIYNEYMNSKISIRALASKYNISDGTMMNIINKYRDEKNKEDQFLTELEYNKEIQIKKPPPNKLSVDTSQKQHIQGRQISKPIIKTSQIPQTPHTPHTPQTSQNREHIYTNNTISDKRKHRKILTNLVDALYDKQGVQQAINKKTRK